MTKLKTKKRGGGPRRSDAAVQKRRKKIISLLKKKPNATTKELATAVKTPLATVSSDLKALREQLQVTNKSSFADFVRKQVELLTTLIEETYTGQITPEVANACRGLADSLAKLTGSHAPEKHSHNHHIFASPDEQSHSEKPTYLFVGSVDELDRDELEEGEQQVLPPALTTPPLDPTSEPVVIDDILTQKRKAAGLLLTDGTEPTEEADV
jgi:DNA-binding transcriptional ArsR family regulator